MVVTLVWMDFNIPRWNVTFSLVAMAILDKNNHVDLMTEAFSILLYIHAEAVGGCFTNARLQELKVLLRWRRKNKTHLIALSIKVSELYAEESRH